MLDWIPPIYGYTLLGFAAGIIAPYWVKNLKEIIHGKKDTA